MPATRGGVLVDPQGRSVVVNMTTPSGAPAEAYTAENGSTRFTFPATISARTGFYVTAPATYTLSVRYQGLEIAGPSGNTLSLGLGDGSLASVAVTEDADEVRTRVTTDEQGARLSNANHLRRWRAALGDAINGRANVVCLGDSITWGVGASGTSNSSASDEIIARSQGWAGQLRALFRATYGDAGEGFIKNNDTLTSVSGGTSSSLTGPMLTGRNMTSGNTTTYALTSSFTAVDVWACSQPSGTATSSATFTVDGGAPTTMTDPATNDTFFKTTLTGLSDAAHTVVVTGPGTNRVFLSGIVARKSTGVVVHRIGKPGGLMTDITTAGQTGTSLTNYRNATLSLCEPNLVILMAGVNDYTAATQTTPDSYAADVQAFVNHAVALSTAPSVLLVGEMRTPTAAGSGGYAESDYYNQLRAIAAATDHVAFLDIADVWGTQAQAHASDMALQLSSSVHPSRKGHGDTARIIFQAISNASLVQT